MELFALLVQALYAIAWPAVVLVVLHYVRKPLADLLPLLVRLKYKDFELDFSRRLEEAEAEAVALPPPTPQALAAPPGESLFALAKVSPRAAILEAWIRVEHAAAEALSRRGLSPPLRDRFILPWS